MPEAPPIRRGPKLRRLLGAAALIGAGPVLALLVLLLFDAVRWPGAMLALGACVAAALALARLWVGDLERLAAALRRAAETPDQPAAGAPADAASPRIPAVAEIAEGVAGLADSLRERGELVGRLRRADAAIVAALPDPLLVLDADRVPLRANHAARALFDGAATGLTGDLAALLRHPAMASAVDRAVADRVPQAADIVLPVPVMRELAVQVIPMEPALSDGGRLVVVLSDRTRDRAVERMRADFVANASHELRTPLASLIGFIETLRGPARDDTEARARFLGIMAEQAERMRRLIDDLLGLTRIELSEHMPPTGTADLAAIAQAETEAMAPILTARRVTLEAALAPACLAAPADAGQLGQVMRNLLENAVRHGREGGTVRLTVAPAPAASPPGESRAMPRLPHRSGVLLTVADDGPGIAREHIPRLTERFYRVDKGRSRGAGGTGLGLAIVKHIVNRHRGQLLIESEEGTGATFRVWLPARETHPATPLPALEPRV